MPIGTHCLRRLAPALMLGLFMAMPARADGPASKVTLETWQHAADPHSPLWSREALLSRLLDGIKVEDLDRQQVLALLGPPGFASESYYPGQGLSGRLDVYRLSARNDRSYTISYEPSGKVTSNSIGAAPCACPRCRDLPGNTDIILQDATVTDLLTSKLVSDQLSSTKIAELEDLVGHPGKKTAQHATAGGQAWVDYYVIWRIAGGGGDHFLIGSGHIPARDWRALDDARVETYDLITLTAECEAP
jgi:hypothetical protein